MDGHPIRDHTLTLRRPAHPAQLGYIRGRVQRWAEHHDVPEDVLIDLQLAVGEAVANGVEHAYADRAPGTVEVEIRLRHRSVLVTVRDHGRWRQPSMAERYRGRGMLVIERVSRRMEVLPTADGTRVGFEIAY